MLFLIKDCTVLNILNTEQSVKGRVASANFVSVVFKTVGYPKILIRISSRLIFSDFPSIYPQKSLGVFMSRVDNLCVKYIVAVNM